MLLMNLENLRKFDFVQKCITYPVENYPKNVMFFHDQAIINDLLKNNITILPSIYNCQLSYAKKYSIDEYNNLIIQGNKLIHFLAETNTDLFFKL
jgi:lipopolysaccharide biosynthesis glycosyltransferase